MDPAVLFFFEKDPAALLLYEAFERAVRELVPDVGIKVQKTQITYTNPKVFAAVSLRPARRKAERPEHYITVTLGLNRRLESPRVDAAVEPYRRRSTGSFWDGWRRPPPFPRQNDKKSVQAGCLGGLPAFYELFFHQLAQSRTVAHQGDIGVQLEDGGGYLGGDGAGEGLLHDVRLVLAADHQQDLTGHHDGLDAHGHGLTGHLVGGGEETGIGLDGTLGEVHHVGLLLEGVAGLVEADVAVMADAQDLDVDAAHVADDLVVPLALRLGVGGQAVGDVGVGGVDVHVVKEVLLHEVAVALLVGGLQADVFIQVHGLDLGEVQVALLVPVDELVIHPHGAGAGGEAHHAVGLQDDLGGEDIGRLAAHGPIIFGHVDLHSCVRSFIFYDDRIDHR